MMRRTLVGLAMVSVVGGVVSTASPSRANLINAGSFVTDTISRLNWLDLPATEGQTYDAVIGGYGGYLAAGWRYATSNEVSELFSHAGGLGPFDNQSFSETKYAAPSALLGSLLGFTHPINQTGTGFGWGLIADSNTSGQHLSAIFQTFGTTGYMVAPFVALDDQTLFAPALDTIRLDIGSFLVSGVPEMSTWAMVIIGFGGVGLRMRRRRSGVPLIA